MDNSLFMDNNNNPTIIYPINANHGAGIWIPTFAQKITQFCRFLYTSTMVRINGNVVSAYVMFAGEIPWKNPSFDARLKASPCFAAPWWINPPIIPSSWCLSGVYLVFTILLNILSGVYLGGWKTIWKRKSAIIIPSSHFYENIQKYLKQLNNQSVICQIFKCGDSSGRS